MLRKIPHEYLLIDYEDKTLKRLPCIKFEW